jgi:hypothetical protein
MAPSVIAAVEAHRVEAVQSLHPFRELGLRRLDQEVEVIAEQRPGVDPPAKAPLYVDQQLPPLGPVDVVQEEFPLLHTAADDVVVRRAGQLRAGNSRHEMNASGGTATAKPAENGHVRGTVPPTRPRDSPSDVSRSATAGVALCGTLRGDA